MVGEYEDQVVCAIGKCKTHRQMDLGDDLMADLIALHDAYNCGGEAAVSERVKGQTLLRNVRSCFFI